MRRTIVIFLCFLASACRSNSEFTEVPAVFVETDSQVRQQVVRIVRKALKKETVRVSNEVFTTSSLLLIERRRQRTIDGVLASNRETELPNQFRLYLNGDSCLILHVQTNQRWILEQANCRPEVKQ